MTEVFFAIGGFTLLCHLGLHKWVVYVKKEEKGRKIRRMCVRCGKGQELSYDFLSPFWRDIRTEIIYGLPYITFLTGLHN